MTLPMNAAPHDIPNELDPLRDPALYFNRELSQLDFNFRVLAQALDPQVPLLERLRVLFLFQYSISHVTVCNGHM